MALRTVPHCDLGPDTCFGCKAHAWRTEGGLAVTYRQGKEFFHNETVAGSIRETLEVAKADGRQLEYVGGGASPVPTSALGAV